ncbi:MAG: macro domain-containing protein [Alphaproteobacteria bacterium]
MKIVLTALDTQLANAWKTACAGLHFVTVHHGSIFDIECDAVVSPANSYGFMDGGIDALYTAQFGIHVQDRVRRAILEHHHGELLVGQADIVETDHPQIPFLIAAPTMRVPMILGSDTVNPYLAARAALLLVRHGKFRDGTFAGDNISDRVKVLAFPGMGTGVGRVPAGIAAQQVRAAIDESMRNKFRLPQSWAEASENHQLLYSDRPKDLQY